MATLQLTASVGNGGKNESADVSRVIARFVELGFDWLSGGSSLSQLTRAIRLFQGIKDGDSSIGGNDGRIDVGGGTHRWLEAANAPRWMKVVPPSQHGEGWRKLITAGDDHDYGTSWLVDTVTSAGRLYLANHLTAHPKASLIVVNDVSPHHGGPTNDHAGHETGLMADLQLPKKNGSAGGIDYWDSDYDRSAARQMILAFRAQKLARGSRIFFNDPVLESESDEYGQPLCSQLSGHNNHIHVEVRPPEPEFD
jgi:hypothetical protein